MNLDEAQKKKVTAWIAEGLRLSEIQNRMASELGIRLTYMEVRLLADDLKLTPRDIEPPRPAASVLNSGAGPGKGAPSLDAPSADASEPTDTSGPAGGVAIDVDQITRAGAVVSGKVTFRDGHKAEWYFDQSGRLGLVPQQAGYRPTAADLQQFQAGLESALSKLGL